MKLSYVATAAVIGLGSLGLVGVSASVQGCSSDKTTDDGATSSGSGARPPAKPSAAAADLGTRQTFALRKLFLGDTDRTGKRDPQAWKKFGYNLDGKNTKSPDAKDVCKPKGGPVPTDGDNGTDNTFGQSILPVLANLLNDPSTTASKALEDGEFTILLDIKGLTPDPKQTATGLNGQLFAGGEFSDAGVKPKWDGTDVWPVRPELLVNKSDPSSGSTVAFNDAYITNGTFVSGAGTGTTAQISLSFAGVTIDLLVQGAYIVATHEGTKLNNGTVAGYVALKDLIDSITKVAGRINTSACPGRPNYRLVVDTLTSAADMMVSGASSGECDAISIGIGFEAQELKPPTTIAVPAELSPDPCLTADDAGTTSDAAPAVDGG